MVATIETGVSGLDEVLNGGLPETAAVLVSGNPGAGKSILGLQYLHEGARDGNRGIYLSFEERASDLETAAHEIGLEEWGALVDEGLITIYDKRDLLDSEDIGTAVDRVLDDITLEEYDRLVLDSLSMFSMFFEADRERRTYLLRFMDILKEAGVTSLLVNEQSGIFPETEIGLENFLTDGNIYLVQTPTQSGVNRYLWVPKMRRQNVRTEIFPMDIEQGGIRVHPDAAGFAMMEEANFGFDR
jgi:KaiC/GvpD/RAD55 family RecA-like ATPase